jgi:hypothetical protein
MLETLRRRQVYSDEIRPAEALELYRESEVDEILVEDPQDVIPGSELELDIYHTGADLVYELVAVDTPGDELYAMLRWAGNGTAALEDRHTLVEGTVAEDYLDENIDGWDTMRGDT